MSLLILLISLLGLSTQTRKEHSACSPLGAPQDAHPTPQPEIDTGWPFPETLCAPQRPPSVGTDTMPALLLHGPTRQLSWDQCSGGCISSAFSVPLLKSAALLQEEKEASSVYGQVSRSSKATCVTGPDELVK